MLLVGKCQEWNCIFMHILLCELWIEDKCLSDSWMIYKGIVGLEWLV